MSEGRVTAGVPDAAIDIPGRVLDLAGTDKIDLVWRNELGGLTFRFRGQKGTRYIKWQSYAGVRPAVRGDVDLAVESEKLRWAGQFVPVPGVLDFGEDGDAAWLVTEAIDATPACDVRWRGDPEVAVRAIAMGLRRFHDTLPVDGCPYRGSWSSREPSAPASASWWFVTAIRACRTPCWTARVSSPGTSISAGLVLRIDGPTWLSRPTASVGMRTSGRATTTCFSGPTESNQTWNGFGSTENFGTRNDLARR